MQLDDQALIDRILDGSSTAFELLMQRYERLVYKLSYGYAREHQAALDATQEVFLRVFEKLNSYRGRGSFKGWLVRIAHNTNLDRQRKHGREPHWAGLEAAHDVADPADHERDLLQRQRRNLLLDELENLNPQQRLAVTLRYFGQMSIGEVAQAMDCSIGNAKNVLFRSLEKLRRRPAIVRIANE